MGFSCGIVGLPNVGKSTLFNALTRSRVAAENYPFCTIDPATGVVPVPDERLQALAEKVRPEKVVPSVMTFVDIAGLVRGASEGEGLGNQFLANIREVQAIAHVVRCFDDENVTHVAGSVDPERDVETIETELLLADLATVEKAIKRVGRQAKGGDAAAKAQLALLERLLPHLEAGEPARTASLTATDAKLLKSFHLLTTKPVLYVANVDEAGLFGDDATEDRHVEAVRRIARREENEVIKLCVKLEAELAELDDQERLEMLRELGLAEPGLHRVIRRGQRLLGLHDFYTVGPKEVRAWTVPIGTTASKAAGVIHSDFERGFIRAEIITVEDFLELGEQGAKEAGKRRSEGKDYVIQEGDVVHFLFNV